MACLKHSESFKLDSNREDMARKIDVLRKKASVDSDGKLGGYGMFMYKESGQWLFE